MKRDPRTAAEAQIEALRQLKQTQAKKRPAPPPAPRTASAAAAPPAASFELSERAAPAAKRSGPALPLSPALWRRLRERQREHREFKRRRAMGDWAAELLLALPPGTAQLPEAARSELLRKMQEWAEARGLR